MTVKITICAPETLVLDRTLAEHVAAVLNRAKISYELGDASNNHELELTLHDASDAEARFLVRVLQRAGYDLDVALD